MQQRAAESASELARRPRASHAATSVGWVYVANAISFSFVIVEGTITLVDDPTVLKHDDSIGALIKIDELLSKHFAVLGATMQSFPLQVFDLGHEDLHGLLGMNFLSDFNFEIRPVECRILVEKIAH